MKIVKRLIINADDFGYSKVFNESILDLIEKKLISSTTVMVNWITEEQSSQVEKILDLKNKYDFSLGLHLEFENTNYEETIKEQYNKFIKIFKIKPSHIDVHKPNYSNEEGLAVQKFCKLNNLPCRNLNYGFKDINMTSNSYTNGTNMTINELNTWIKTLNDNESYEILFHPGTYDKDCKSSLNEKRKDDIEKIKLLKSILLENDVKMINYEEL